MCCATQWAAPARPTLHPFPPLQVVYIQPDQSDTWLEPVTIFWSFWWTYWANFLIADSSKLVRHLYNGWNVLPTNVEPCLEVNIYIWNSEFVIRCWYGPTLDHLVKTPRGRTSIERRRWLQRLKVYLNVYLCRSVLAQSWVAKRSERSENANWCVEFLNCFLKRRRVDRVTISGEPPDPITCKLGFPLGLSDHILAWVICSSLYFKLAAWDSGRQCWSWWQMCLILINECV